MNGIELMNRYRMIATMLARERNPRFEVVYDADFKDDLHVRFHVIDPSYPEREQTPIYLTRSVFVNGRLHELKGDTNQSTQPYTYNWRICETEPF